MLTLRLFVQLQTCKGIVHLELHVTVTPTKLFLLFSEILQCNTKFLIVVLTLYGGTILCHEYKFWIKFDTC